jgi:hypothetical protein
MTKDYIRPLKEVLKLTLRIFKQVGDGDQHLVDREYGEVYGILRDSAYKLIEMVLKDANCYKTTVFHVQ